MAKLCCPLCKGQLTVARAAFECIDCGSTYPTRAVQTGAGQEDVHDFRIDRGPFSTVTLSKWELIQCKYEDFTDEQAAKDDLTSYRREIDSVREIYTEEFELIGDVLDVGGHQGRLRHFLPRSRSGTYVSVDPFLNVFENVALQPGLLEAYEILRNPCNFLCCHAEHLPFRAREFDWVHMRSVLDHFYDPYLALKEAFRVLRPEGKILVGLTVEDPPRSDGASREMLALKKARTVARWMLGRTAHDEHHMMVWREADVDRALHEAGFALVKKHWQKPPYSMCLYTCAQRE